MITAHATNYRNILDSNVVEIDQSTCLVGKNEAGKSAFLKALEGLRSTDPSFTQYNKITNYPRKNLAEYVNIHDGNEAVVMTATWELEPADVTAVEAELGTDVIQANTFEVSKSYEETAATWTLTINEAKVLANLISRSELGADDKAVLSEARTTLKAYEALEGLATRTPAQDALFALIGDFRDRDATLRAIDILSKRMPKFMYFSHWDRMSGEVSLTRRRGQI
nr:AAA family ATPase [Polymorphobacter multimanifer]